MSSPLLRLPGILILGALVFSLPLPTKHVSANYVSPVVNEGELLQKYISWSAQVFSRNEVAQIFSAIGSSQDLELLERYTQFSQFSKADRKVRFNQISAQEKSDLWRVHLGLNLARHPEWNDLQRSIVLEAIGIASPSLYQVPKDKNWMRLVNEPMQLFAQRAKLVFSEEEAADLFAELGAKEPKAHHAKLTAVSNCGCSQTSNWCSQSCDSSECTILIWGCGTFGIYACDGKCSSTRRV